MRTVGAGTSFLEVLAFTRPRDTHPALLLTRTHVGRAIHRDIEMIRRVARGFRNFDNYRLRALLAARGTNPGDKPYPLLNMEGQKSTAISTP